MSIYAVFYVSQEIEIILTRTQLVGELVDDILKIGVYRIEKI